MDPELKKEIQKLRADVSALVSLLPGPYRLVVRPVIDRLIGILERIASEL